MRRLILPLLLLAAAAPAAQARQSVTVAPRGRVYTARGSDDGDRAMLGISTGSSGKRDTLGLLIESVTAGSPADKAGLEEGDRIASVNGVNLKLSRDDAGESDMSGAMTNRLIREMRKLKAGDEASLEVWSGGHHKAVKVKTVAADDLEPDRMSRRDAEDRPVLGISLGSSGSKRDTLGVFVSGVTDNGPADKAGIVEGDRIASVNGVDLRVSRDDIGDWSVAGARVRRLQREISKLKAGQTVDLSVVGGGRARTVKVTLGRSKDMERSNGFSFSTGDGASFITMPKVPMAPMAPMSPMAPMPPMPPSPPRGRVRVFGGDADADVTYDRLEALRDIGPRIRAEIERDMPRVREEFDNEFPRAMDEMRRSLDKLKIEMPQMRARLGRGVII